MIQLETMKKILLFLFVIVTWIFLLLSIEVIINIRTPETIARYPNAQYLSSLVNNWRVSKNLQSLTKNEKLCSLADVRSVEIQTDFTHAQFFPLAQPITNKYHVIIGENLSKGFDTEQETLNAWLNSPEHYQNLVDSKFTQTCIVCKQTYCVQEFASGTF